MLQKVVALGENLSAGKISAWFRLRLCNTSLKRSFDPRLASKRCGGRVHTFPREAQGLIASRGSTLIAGLLSFALTLARARSDSLPLAHSLEFQPSTGLNSRCVVSQVHLAIAALHP